MFEIPGAVDITLAFPVCALLPETGAEAVPGVPVETGAEAFAPKYGAGAPLTITGPVGVAELELVDELVGLELLLDELEFDDELLLPPPLDEDGLELEEPLDELLDELGFSN